MNETPKELDAAVKVILDYKPPQKNAKGETSQVDRSGSSNDI